MSLQCYLWQQVRLMNADEEEGVILQHISADRLANPVSGKEGGELARIKPGKTY